MLQWSDQLYPQEGWVPFLIILIFGLFVFVYQRHPRQMSMLLKFWRIDSYIKIYNKEKFIKLNHAVNLFLIFISLITFSFLADAAFKLASTVPLIQINFFSTALFLSGFVIGRYIILSLIFKILGKSDLLQQTIFKSLGNYGMMSLYAFLLFLIYYYNFYEFTLFIASLILAVCCYVFVSHFLIYLRILGSNPRLLFYIILYLCAFKIAPWLWLYKLIF